MSNKPKSSLPDDTDYIRKAVELADGWEWFNSVACKAYNDVLYIDDVDAPERVQITKDALAAQLLRQANAAKPGSVRSFGDSMRAIKCCVDVLDTDREGQ